MTGPPAWTRIAAEHSCGNQRGEPSGVRSRGDQGGERDEAESESSGAKDEDENAQPMWRPSSTILAALVRAAPAAATSETPSTSRLPTNCGNIGSATARESSAALNPST